MSLAYPVAQGAEVPVAHHGPVRLAAQDGPIEAGVDEQTSVRQPAQSGRLPVEGDLGPSLAPGGHGEDGVIEEVRVPEAPVVPAGTLAEAEPRDERLGDGGVDGHGADLLEDPPGPVPQFSTSPRRARCPCLLPVARRP